MSFQTPRSPPVGLVDDNMARVMRNAQLEQAQQQQEQLKQQVVGAVTSPIGLGLLTGLFVMLFLWLLNPPMVREGGKSSLEKQHPSMLKIAAWGIVSGGIVALTPVFLKMFR